MSATNEPVVLSIAGSDPSGGAGIQADLKTATALGVYSASVLTALTAQNTHGVQGIHAVPVPFVLQQLRSVLDDLDVRAIKIGMLGDPALVEALADALADVDAPIVLDPVMVATSGDVLVPEAAVEAIVERLVPLAAVLTPNVPEAELLGGVRVESVTDLEAAGTALLRRGARSVLVKGGHLSGASAVDVLVRRDAAAALRFTHGRVETPHTHGTGCTLSSAIAARLAAGDELEAAIERARAFLLEALRSGAGRRVGGGRGPVDHLVRIGR